MEIHIIELQPMILVGVVGTGESVSEIDIAGLWDRFVSHEEKIQHKTGPEVGYELHIEEETQPKMHFTLVGVAVEKLEALPLELFAKSVPGGTYVQYTHHFKDGDYGDAFKLVYDWIKQSAYEPAHAFDIQVYGERFKGSEDPDSVLEILVPVREK